MSLPFRKSGGGFLNGVAGTIVGYNLDAKEWPGKKGGDAYTTLSVELDILQDGADEPVQQFLQAGFLNDEVTVSDDAQSLESEDDKSIIPEDSEFGRFLQSAVDASFPEEGLVEANLRNFAALVNQRFTFKREVDAEATAKFGKRKGKDGKEYNRDLLLVSEYHGEVEAKSAMKGAKKTSAPAKSAKSSKKDAEDFTEAEAVLLAILADAKDNKLERTALSGKIVRYAVDNKLDNATRESYRKLIGSEDFLSREAGWSFDASKKGQPVELA